MSSTAMETSKLLRFAYFPVEHLFEQLSAYFCALDVLDVTAAISSMVVTGDSAEARLEIDIFCRYYLDELNYLH